MGWHLRDSFDLSSVVLYTFLGYDMAQKCHKFVPQPHLAGVQTNADFTTSLKQLLYVEIVISGRLVIGSAETIDHQVTSDTNYA